MKFNYLKIFVPFFFLISMLDKPALSQKVDSDKSRKQYEKALQFYKKDQVSAALKVLNGIIEEDSVFVEAWLLKGDIHNDRSQFTEAVYSYKKAISCDSAFFPPASFLVANLLFDLEQYKEAKRYYEKYLQFHPKIQAELKRIAENLKLCDFRFAMMNAPVKFNPVNIGPNINSAGFEYINTLSLDEGQLYFTRKGTEDHSDENFFRAVSVMDSLGNQVWEPAVRLGEPINTPGDEGALCVSPDGMTIFITCCSRRDSYGSCDIYQSHRKGNNWTEPENLGPEVNSAAWESQPCLSADGRTLYFISNRRGGFGASDIYTSTMLPDGKWDIPVNIGGVINTEADEMAPFIHPDGRTLYFSSRGHAGMGAADLFVSRLGPDNRWQKPENLGYPVNTKHDEINLIINAKGDEAYISAERDNGFGHTDIYRFELPQQVRPASVSYVHGKVFDKANLQPLAAIFELIDMQSNRSIINSVSDGISGEFLLCLPVNKEYALNVSCKGYLFSSLNFSLGKGNDSLNPKNIDIPMQAVEVGKKVVLRNIFFETDKCELLPESKAELGKLVEFLTNNPTLRIEISGHTDDQGSDAYNLTLSENRARAVNDYLLKQGIDAARLTYQGYGESLPIDTNTTPEGRANNRRTEFKVVTK